MWIYLKVYMCQRQCAYMRQRQCAHGRQFTWATFVIRACLIDRIHSGGRAPFSVLACSYTMPAASSAVP